MEEHAVAMGEHGMAVINQMTCSAATSAAKALVAPTKRRAAVLHAEFKKATEKNAKAEAAAELAMNVRDEATAAAELAVIEAERWNRKLEQAISEAARATRAEELAI